MVVVALLREISMEEPGWMKLHLYILYIHITNTLLGIISKTCCHSSYQFDSRVYSIPLITIKNTALTPRWTLLLIYCHGSLGKKLALFLQAKVSRVLILRSLHPAKMQFISAGTKLRVSPSLSPSFSSSPNSQLTKTQASSTYKRWQDNFFLMRRN